MKKYILSEKGQQDVAILLNLAQSILKRLAIAFTVEYLEDALTQAYYDIKSEKRISENPDEILFVNWNDPSNMAVVLLEALKNYHIKNEIAHIPDSPGESVTLIILNQQEKTQSWSCLLGVVESEQRNELLVTLADKTNQRIAHLTENLVENYVVLKKSNYSEEPDYASRNSQKEIKVFLQFAVLLLLTTTLGLALYNAIENVHALLWIPVLIISFCGIYLCYNLFMLDKTNFYTSDLIKKYCFNNKKGLNCKAVLSSKASRVFGMSMTDIGSVYFSSLFAFTLFGLLTNQYEQYMPVLFWYAVLPLPYTLFSIYYQVRVLKKICVLCLSTHILLWLQFAYYLFIRNQIEVLSIPLQTLVIFLLTAAIIAALYFLFVQYRTLHLNRDRLLLENSEIKNDIGFFNVLSAREERFDGSDIPDTLVIGNKNAQVKLTAILSLSCLLCGDRLKELLKLSDWFENKIQINILILPGKNAKNLLKDVLHFTLAGSAHQAVRLLTNWYRFLKESIDRGDRKYADKIERWQHEQTILPEEPTVEDTYKIHVEWFKKQRIPHTPVIIFNKRLLPQQYYDTHLLINIVEKHLEQGVSH